MDPILSKPFLFAHKKIDFFIFWYYMIIVPIKAMQRGYMTSKSESEELQNPKIKREFGKWHKSSKGGIRFIKIDGNTFVFETCHNQFTILVPSDYPKCDEGILFIESEDEWLSSINTYINENEPSFLRLLRHIDRESLKHKENSIDIDIDSFMEDEELLTEFDIDEMKLRSLLENSVAEMKSSIASTNSSKVPVLFSGNKPGKMLIDELMDVRKEYKGTRRITVEAVDNNIYHWRIIFRDFSNKDISNDLEQVNKRYKYDYVEIHALFHDKLYPSYPPFIKVIRPRLNNSLMHRITNMKMIQLEYWTPTRNMKYVISKLFTVLDKHISINVESDMNNIEKYPEGAYHSLESVLVQLASLCDVKSNYEPLDSTEYKRLYNLSQQKQKTPRKSSSKSNTYWKPGTGYGHGGCNNWNVEEYIALQCEKDVQIQSILQRVVDVVQDSPNLVDIAHIFESSYMIPFIKSYLRGTTMLEMSKHKDIYKLIFVILQNFASELTVFLFCDRRIGKNLYDLLNDIQTESEKINKFLTNVDDKGDDGDIEDVDGEISQMVTFLYEMITPCYKNYMELQKKLQEEGKQKWENKLEEAKNTSNPEHKKYNDEMEQYNFDICNISKFTYTAEKTVGRKLGRRMRREFGTLSSLPVFFQSSIFARVDEKNSRRMKVMITGPEGTPYDSGVFLFDLYLGEGYPSGPPNMKLLNTGGIRFNPNLYDCGKVCLSLLGTWSGTGGEKWNEQTSTLQQLFISVQSQILIDEPYYNEPSWESHYSSNGINPKSKNYNNYTRYYTMCYAMCDLLSKPNNYPEFKEVIQKHFALKKDHVLKACQKWVDESYSINSGPQQSGNLDKQMYKNKYNELKNLLDKLNN